MKLRKKELIHLPVYTESGQHLGRVIDFELDSATHTIERYCVGSRDVIKELLQETLLVSAEQVVSISDEKMIVEDTVVPLQHEKEVIKKAVAAGS